jgi:hypothetical protein
MKISLKQVLAVGALAVASTSAFADISLPNAGNGELTLVVIDQVTQTTYVRGLGLTIDQIATTAQLQAADATYSAGSTAFNVPTAFNLSADSNLQAFLTTAGSDSVTWSVVGGGVTGTGNVTGVKRYVTTSAALSATEIASVTTNAKITSNYSNLQAYDSAFSGSIQNANGGDTTLHNMQSAPSTGLTSGQLGTYQTWNGALTSTNQVALGSTANFYLLSSAQGTTGTAARVYQLSGLTLSSGGTLTGGPAGPVTPIPAAFWLLGTGLAGLVGIGRRKNA